MLREIELGTMLATSATVDAGKKEVSIKLRPLKPTPGRWCARDIGDASACPRPWTRPNAHFMRHRLNWICYAVLLGIGSMKKVSPLALLRAAAQWRKKLWLRPSGSPLLLLASTSSTTKDDIVSPAMLVGLEVAGTCFDVVLLFPRL